MDKCVCVCRNEIRFSPNVHKRLIDNCFGSSKLKASIFEKAAIEHKSDVNITKKAQSTWKNNNWTEVVQCEKKVIDSPQKMGRSSSSSFAHWRWCVAKMSELGFCRVTYLYQHQTDATQNDHWLLHKSSSNTFSTGHKFQKISKRTVMVLSELDHEFHDITCWGTSLPILLRMTLKLSGSASKIFQFWRPRRQLLCVWASPGTSCLRSTAVFVNRIEQ